jgi:DNA-binding protein HU-beta
MHPRRLKSRPIEAFGQLPSNLLWCLSTSIADSGEKRSKAGFSRIPHEGGDGQQRWFFLEFKRTWVARVSGFWHNPGLQMTKTELQVALAAATETNKRTAGVFLETLSALAYKEIKKNGEFVLPGFGKLVKQKRKARTGFNPKTQQKIKIPAKTVVKFRVAKAAKDAVLGVKK